MSGGCYSNGGGVPLLTMEGCLFEGDDGLKGYLSVVDVSGLKQSQAVLPPLKAKESFAELFVKAVAEYFSGGSCDDGIGGYVFGDNGMRGDNGAIADGHAAAYKGSVADPYVVADGDFVKLLGQLIEDKGCVCFFVECSLLFDSVLVFEGEGWRVLVFGF